MRVLIVEDNKRAQEYLKDSIETQGHEVMVAKDGISGIESFKKFQPQVVFSDILMPKMNGLELLKKIKELNEQTIVVLNTAFDNEEYVLSALRLKVDNYLKKPIRHAELFSLLAEYSSTIDSIERPTVLGKRVKKTYVIDMPSQLNCVATVVNRLILEVGGSLKNDQVLDVKLGLSELLRNAVMHGNLGIRYKNPERFINGMDLEKACQEELMQKPELVNQKVRVKYQLLDDRCEWTIMDEGIGFDWRKILRELDHSKTHLECMGIFISKFHFDELEYLGCGNTVRATKYTLETKSQSWSQKKAIKLGNIRYSPLKT